MFKSIVNWIKTIFLKDVEAEYNWENEFNLAPSSWIQVITYRMYSTDPHFVRQAQ